MSNAEDARFEAFMESTEDWERDWIAFTEFEEASRRAAACAGLVNLYDESGLGSREQDQLRVVISQMLFRALPNVDLGTILAEVEGIGYAIRYGIIRPVPSALDHIADTEAFVALAKRGYVEEARESNTR